MQKIWLSFFAVILFWVAPEACLAQQQSQPPTTRYWVTLRDKHGVRFEPAHYFSAAARARRTRQHLPAFEATDLPVRLDYVAAIAARVDTVTLVSR